MTIRRISNLFLFKSISFKSRNFSVIIKRQEKEEEEKKRKFSIQHGQQRALSSTAANPCIDYYFNCASGIGGGSGGGSGNGIGNRPDDEPKVGSVTGQEEGPKKIVSFEEVVAIAEDIKKKGVSESEYRLIDVREPDEIKQSGSIKGAIHIPIAQVPKAMRISPADFFKIFGQEKFKSNHTLVFFCQSGKRSQVAVDLAVKNGFRAFNYLGSYSEWSRKNEEEMKPKK